MRAGHLLALAMSAAILTGCGTTDDPEDGPVSQPTPPGQTEPVWSPTIPGASIDPAAVGEEYAATIDALVDAAGDGLTWGRTTTTVESFEGTCAVTLQRAATGTVSGSFDEIRSTLDTAATPAGFPELRAANDPGGAIRFVAEDDSGALLEFRSKDQTTLAIRVATVASDCT